MHGTQPAVRPTSKAEEAYDWIIQQLVSRQLSPGDRISESGVAKRLGVNRAAVREAFAALVADRLVEQRDNRRYYIASPGPAEHEEIRGFRATLESGAAWLAAQHKTEDDLRELKDLIADHRYFAQRGYWRAVSEADQRFHLCIVRASRNRTLIDTYGATGIRLRMTPREHADTYELERTVPEHEAIVAAIKGGRSQDAYVRVWEHLMKEKEEEAE
jgi:DNA-binding GntR family transcriptional regulator